MCRIATAHRFHLPLSRCCQESLAAVEQQHYGTRRIQPSISAGSRSAFVSRGAMNLARSPLASACRIHAAMENASCWCPCDLPEQKSCSATSGTPVCPRQVCIGSLKRILAFSFNRAAAELTVKMRTASTGFGGSGRWTHEGASLLFAHDVRARHSRGPHP